MSTSTKPPMMARLRMLPLGTWLSLAYLVVIVLLSVLATWVVPYDPTDADVAASFNSPSWSHWLGTDDLGRDSLTRLLYGARVSLLAAMLATGVALGLGVPLGLIAGYYGGAVDSVIMRAFDTIMTFPGIVLAIAITAALGPSMVNAMVAVGVVGSPMFARLVRAQALSVREGAYVEASRTFGSGGLKIIANHILPNSIMPVVVQSSIYLGVALIAEATLSFLGLGVRPPDPSWGGMLAAAQTFMTTEPLQMLPPGIALTATVLAFNTLGESLRTAMDPRAVGR